MPPAADARVAELVLALLREQADTSLAALGPDELALLPGVLEAQGLTMTLFHRAKALPGLSDHTGVALRASYDEHLHVHLRALADLPNLVGTLDQLGVDWVLFKGPVLAEAIYDRPNRRSYRDLDVLVDRRAFGEVLRELERAGCRLVDRNWPVIRGTRRGELNLLLPHGTMLDLHWHLLNERRIRSSFHLSVDDVLRRRREISVDGVSVPTLDAADTLIHLTMHATVSGGHQLSWCKDIQQAVLHDEPPWDELVGRAKDAGLGLVVAAMLGRSHRILGAPVPEEVLAALAPRNAWQALVRAAEATMPPQRSSGHHSARTLLASTRRSTFASATQFGRTIGRELVWDTMTNERGVWRRRLLRQPPPAAEPNPLHRDVPAEADRRAFLRAVRLAR